MEKEESLLLMWVVTEPVMALIWTSPWLAVTLTGALMALTWTSPWLAMMVAAAAAGRVIVRSARAPSSEGTRIWTLLPLLVRLGLNCCALLAASASERL